jgi:hypothetical protein
MQKNQFSSALFFSSNGPDIFKIAERSFDDVTPMEAR